jgi:hypothetical protein
MEFLFWLLIEFLVQVVGEIVFGFFWEGIGHAFRWNRNAHPLLAAFGWMIIGAATGAVSVLIFPDPILQHTRFHGFSLIAAPFATGALMKFFGDQVRARGRETTSLMTFWSGSMFALAFAVVRFSWISAVAARSGG